MGLALAGSGAPGLCSPCSKLTVTDLPPAVMGERPAALGGPRSMVGVPQAPVLSSARLAWRVGVGGPVPSARMEEANVVARSATACPTSSVREASDRAVGPAFSAAAAARSAAWAANSRVAGAAVSRRISSRSWARMPICPVDAEPSSPLPRVSGSLVTALSWDVDGLHVRPPRSISCVGQRR